MSEPFANDAVSVEPADDGGWEVTEKLACEVGWGDEGLGEAQRKDRYLDAIKSATMDITRNLDIGAPP
jgi:hypothetical protein